MSRGSVITHQPVNHHLWSDDVLWAFAQFMNDGMKVAHLRRPVRERWRRTHSEIVIRTLIDNEILKAEFPDKLRWRDILMTVTKLPELLSLENTKSKWILIYLTKLAYDKQRLFSDARVSKDWDGRPRHELTTTPVRSLFRLLTGESFSIKRRRWILEHTPAHTHGHEAWGCISISLSGDRNGRTFERGMQLTPNEEGTWFSALISLKKSCERRVKITWTLGISKHE